jgi:hypothetical protein
MRKTSAIILSLTAMLLVLTVAFGQGCSSVFPVSSSLEVIKGFSQPGNGGGYGGMRSTANGTYGMRGGSAPNAMELTAYLFSQSTVACSTYPSGWETTGSYVSGVLSLMEPKTYTSTFCGTPSPVVTEVSLVDYSSQIVVYNGDLFQRFETIPSALADIDQPIAFCRKTEPFLLTQTGTDVLIYSRGGKTLARISLGRNVNNEPLSFRVEPFEVSAQQTDLVTSFTAESFSMSVNRTGQKTSTGSVSVLLDDTQLDLTSDCWLVNP